MLAFVFRINWQPPVYSCNPSVQANKGWFCVRVVWVRDTTQKGLSASAARPKTWKRNCFFQQKIKKVLVHKTNARKRAQEPIIPFNHLLMATMTSSICKFSTQFPSSTPWNVSPQHEHTDYIENTQSFASPVQRLRHKKRQKWVVLTASLPFLSAWLDCHNGFLYLWNGSFFSNVTCLYSITV